MIVMTLICNDNNLFQYEVSYNNNDNDYCITTATKTSTTTTNMLIFIIVMTTKINVVIDDCDDAYME
jgi:hypothetical protein